MTKLQNRKNYKSLAEQRFLDHIYEEYQAGQRFCFVLGAGASKASGIRTGEELMREWHGYLSNKGPTYIKNAAEELALGQNDYLPLFQDGYRLKNDDYFTLFDLRFAGMPNVAYAYLEKEMEEKYPSYGYFPLAMLLTHTQNRLVITTNFDTLLEDSLYTYTFKHPLVVGHESLASYIGNDTRHPVIAKIHRDLLFRPLNRKEDMDKLADEWEKPLCNALSKYIPIVIGYAGGDHTFMSLLQRVELSKIYWCHLGNAPAEPIRNVVAKHNGYFVKILGFDEILFRLGERFSEEIHFGDPCQYMRDQAEERCSLYLRSFEKIREKYTPQKPDPAETPFENDNTEDVAEMIDALHRYDNKDGDSLLIEAQKAAAAGQLEDAYTLYSQLIQQKPENAEYYNMRSAILHKMSRYQEAVADDTIAIKLEPQNARFYNSRGVSFYSLQEYEAAVNDYTKAIELQPQTPLYYNNRGISLHEMEQYKEAIQDKTKAIELEPSNADFYSSRGVSFHSAKLYEKAVQDYSKAIELNPSNVVYYHNRAVTLHDMKQYERSLADRKKAIKLNPSNGLYYQQRALTLDMLKQYATALEDYSKAIELEPSNAIFWYSRGLSYSALNQHEKAVQDYSEAIKLDPSNVQIYENRAVSLHKLGRAKEAAQDQARAIQ